ncbi:MAG: hypothetical protein L6R41_006942 [Letrouitia leprolyta]|nr:MAG: hypothetical protein L6R41_006942 [Letrouitia leprolyta]
MLSTMYNASYVPLCIALLAMMSIPQMTAENFDPAQADPRKNITCVGDSYDLSLPILGEFNPNLLTMQQLCAKPQFGGGLPERHVGGWCNRRVMSLPQLAFDINPAARINSILSNLRVYLACIYRCFCNYGIVLGAPQPRARSYDGSTVLRSPVGEVHQYQVEVIKDFDTSWLQATTSWVTSQIQEILPFLSGWLAQPQNIPTNAGIQTVLPPQEWQPNPNDRPVSIRLAIRNQSWSDDEPVELRSLPLASLNVQVSHDPSNDIVCDGDLPDFPLPGPYQRSDFSNLQKFRAIQTLRGLRSVLIVLYTSELYILLFSF